MECKSSEIKKEDKKIITMENQKVSKEYFFH